jgi:hypothetical protein
MGKPGFEPLGHRLAGPSTQKRSRGSLESLADGYNLVRGFTLAEHHLRIPLTQLAVVIYSGEGEIFEGEMPQSVERRLGCYPAGSDVGEESFDLLGGHAT